MENLLNCSKKLDILATNSTIANKLFVNTIKISFPKQNIFSHFIYNKFSNKKVPEKANTCRNNLRHHL